jgi:autotransporter-associated beta strand protein
MTRRGKSAALAAAAVAACPSLALFAARPEGIDVSEFQGTVDWNTVHTTGGKDFVFIRATRGGTTGVGSNGGLNGTGACRYDDPRFSGNIAGAKAAGMLAGTYHFARADRYDPADPTGLTGNFSSPEDEARHFLEIAGAYMKPGYLRPVLDLESGNNNTNAAQLSDWVVRFMNTIVANKGVTPLIYVNTNFAFNEVNSSVAVYDLWLARPSASSDSQNGDPVTPIGFAHPYGVWGNGTPKPWKFWQYSQSGSCPGISGAVDLDVVHEEVTPLASFKVPGFIWTGSISPSYGDGLNWDSGMIPAANNDVLFDTPIVGQGAGMITMGPADQAQSIYFADNYTLRGGTSTSLFLAAGRIDVDTGKTAIVSTVLAGTNGFRKVGNGTLVIDVDSTMTGTRTIAGGVVSIDNQSRLGSAVSSLVIDGGTLRTTNPTTGLSIVNANVGLFIGVDGGTVECVNAGVANIYQGTITAIGGTTINGGSGTLVKIGAGELRYQNAGTANSTFRKLIVRGGLFRLGNVPGNNFETGFGAVPTSFLADAITLDGGAIGSSYPLTVNVNRGITLGAAGGTLDATAASLNVPGIISGSTSLLVKGSVTLSGSNTYSGDTVIGNGTNATTLFISNPANLGDPANHIVFNLGTLRTQGAMNLGRDIIVTAGGGTIDTSTFSVTAGNIDGTGNFTRTTTPVSPNTLTVNHVRLGGGTLTVTAGTLRIAAGLGLDGVSRVGTLTIAANGKLDLNDNKVITTTPVGTLSGNTYTGVTGMVQTGRSGGTWTGATGIITSQTSATMSSLTGIGVATVAQAKGIAATQTAQWSGQTVTGSDTLVMYTYGGDANLDGKLNVDDYGRIDSNIGLGTAGWYNGDFNYDGKVNVDDYGILDSNVAVQGPPFPTASRGQLPVSGEAAATAVPEPVAGTIALLGLTRMLRMRRRSLTIPPD